VRKPFVAAILIVVLLCAAALPAVAGEPTSTSTTVDVDQRMIPRPNSGVAPQDIGDRGGAAQLALMVATFGGVVLIGLLVVRESRRARARTSRPG
jgi:hypothetical protein